MNESQSLESVQCTILLRAIYVLIAPIMLVFTALACGTVVTDTPFYTCPTVVPPTDAPQSTYLPGTPIPFPTLIP